MNCQKALYAYIQRRRAAWKQNNLAVWPLSPAHEISYFSLSPPLSLPLIETGSKFSAEIYTAPTWRRYALIYSKRGSKARMSRHTKYGGGQKNSQLQTLIKNQESEFRSYRQGLGRIRIEKQRSVLYNITYKNQHRIKINVLTVWQTDRLEYLYTGILNILRGSWDVRRD